MEMNNKNDELPMLTDSVAHDEDDQSSFTVEEGYHTVLLSETLELIANLESIEVMEGNVVTRLAVCLKQLVTISQTTDRKDRLKLSIPFEQHTNKVYTLLNRFFAEWDGLSTDCHYYTLLDSILSWTDTNSMIAHEINCNGHLVCHARHLHAIKLKEQELDPAVLEETVMAILMILHNCVMDPNLPHYYYADGINWSLLLSPWAMCSHYCMRLFSRFILGYLMPGLQEETLELLDMEQNDWNLFMKMLKECSQPPFSATLITSFASTIKDLAKYISEGEQPSITIKESVPEIMEDMPDYVQQLSIDENQLTVAIDFDDSNCCLMPASEIISGLSNLVARKANLHMLDSFSFLPCLLSLLTNGTVDDKSAVCKLLTALQCNCETIEKELSNASSCLSVLIEDLHTLEDVELQELSKCVFSSTVESNNDVLLSYAKLCYKYRRYKECNRQCSTLNNCIEAKILKAKCLYHIYTLEQVLLNQKSDTLSKQALQQELGSCYSKAREVIGILGKALDEKLLLFDAECSEMLDLAMIDYMHNTNKLRDARRCLLCRVYQGENIALAQSSVELDSGNTIDNDATGSTKSKQSSKSSKRKPKAGLLASHLYPESILKQFGLAVPLAKGKKVYSASGFKVSHDELHSFGELTFYMLCHNCEELFSVSESWFLQHFFKKIYNINQPSSAKCEQSIPYTSHLYTFCLSLIFRWLKCNSLEALNSDEVYNLFQQCQDCLLNTSQVTVNKPLVYLLISPFNEDEGNELGSINHFLTAVLTHCFGLHPLGVSLEAIKDHPSTKVHFLVIHMGVINILVKFKPSQEYPVDENFRILEEGGVYHVPHNDVRKKLLPPGLYALFQIRSMKMEKAWLEGPTLTYDPLQDPDSNATSTFGILEAQYKDEGRVISEKKLRSFSDEHDRTICFLPRGFGINPPVTLPKGHRILLHHVHGNQKAGIMLFICIGLSASDGYGVEKPYVVYYIYKPGFIYAFGFFISQNLEAISYVPKSKGVASIQNPEDLLKSEDVSDIIKCTLEEKGFYSLNSLICRLKVFASSDLHYPLLDSQCTPCSSEELKRCAYCINLCDYCFHPVPGIPLTVQGPEESGLDFKFCNNICYRASAEPPKFSYYYIVHQNNLVSVDGKTYPHSLKNVVPCCSPVSSGHKLILHLVTFTVNWAGYMRQNEIAICTGSFEGLDNTAAYIVYYARSLTGQQALEFFLLDDLSPGDPLPYLQHQEVPEIISELKDSGIIQDQLHTLVQMLADISSSEIPPTLFGVINVLPLTLSNILSPVDEDYDLKSSGDYTNNQSHNAEEEMQLDNLFESSQN